MTYKNYHAMLLPNRRDGEPTTWTCEYCGKEGPMDEMQRGDCSFTYPTCEVCGGCEDSNECRPDCSGIAALLSNPHNYVIEEGGQR
jgi:hypothetical protein